MAKELSEMHPMQVVFCRAFGSFVFIFPYILYKKISIVGHEPKWLFLRGFLGLISLATFFIALQRIPLGSAISIRYLGPIFGAALAMYFLKERVNWKQWMSFAVAFTGVLILKGFDVRIDLLSFSLLLISAFLVGAVFVLIRYLTAKENVYTIINYFMVIAIVTSLFFISYWRTPLAEEWTSVIGIGILGLVGQVFMTKSFELEEASVLAPFKYLELIYALIIGYAFFGETYSYLPFVGILLIFIGMLANVRFKDKI